MLMYETRRRVTEVRTRLHLDLNAQTDWGVDVTLFLVSVTREYGEHLEQTQVAQCQGVGARL